VTFSSGRSGDIFTLLQQVLISFHVGGDVVHPDELWGMPITMDFFLFKTVQIRQELEMAGFTMDEDIERGSHSEVEYQGRRAYIFARRPELRAELPLKLDL
jgi:hypothetical protein